MFENKKVTYNDNKVDKEFLITPFPAVPALKLVVEILSLMSNTDVIKSVIMQQFVHNVLQTGVKVDGLDPAEFQAMLEMDSANFIANIINSIIHGLNDKRIDEILEKCLSNVLYLNGSERHNAYEALQYGMIQDFTVVIGLLKDVMMLNFAGAFDRAKKHLGWSTETVSPENI